MAESGEPLAPTPPKWGEEPERDDVRFRDGGQTVARAIEHHEGITAIEARRAEGAVSPVA